MFRIIGFLKLVIQVWGIVKSIVDAVNTQIKESEKRKLDEQRKKREELEDKVKNDNELSESEKRKILEDLLRNSF